MRKQILLFHDKEWVISTKWQQQNKENRWPFLDPVSDYSQTIYIVETVHNIGSA